MNETIIPSFLLYYQPFTLQTTNLRTDFDALVFFFEFLSFIFNLVIYLLFRRGRFYGFYYLSFSIAKRKLLIKVIVYLLGCQNVLIIDFNLQQLVQQMQIESPLASLKTYLSNCSSVVHKKALAILQTILKTVQPQLQLQSEENVNLIVFTLLYKHCKKSIESQSIQNSTSYILLIHYLLPQINTESLESAGVLSNLKQLILKTLDMTNKNLLGFRYSVSILAEFVLCSRTQQTEYNSSIVDTLLQITLKSTKNIERREAAKNLKSILDKYPTFGTRLGQQTKRILEENTSDHIYMNSIKSIAGFYPVVLLNDICYLLRPYLRVEEQTYNKKLTTQAYFFLDSVMGMQLVTGDISEEILKELIHNIPDNQQGDDNRIMFGYLQCIHQCFVTLNRASEKTSHRYISSVVSVVSQMLVGNGKIPKQAEGILKEVINVGVTESLWIRNTEQFDLQNLEIDGESNSFKKLVAMLQDLLSTRYDDKRHSSFEVLKQFFNKLNVSAYQQVEPIILEIIKERERFQIGEFNELFGTVIEGVGYQKILDLLPLTVNGDPTEQSFQNSNNLWLLEIISKNSPAGSFQIFISVIYPLLQQIYFLRMQSQHNKGIQQIYQNLSLKLWATFANLCLPEQMLFDWERCVAYIESNIAKKEEHLPLVLHGLIQLLNHQTINLKYFATKAEKLIETLIKVLDIKDENNKVQQVDILKSISNLSKVCNREHLESMFLNYITQLLTDKANGALLKEQEVWQQNKKTTILTANQSLKKIEILMAICHGINFKDQSAVRLGNQRLTKMECILEYLRNFIQEKNIFQKKAYKFMLQCFEFMPEGYIYEAKDLIDAEVQVDPSSRSYRLGVLHALWNNNKYSDQNCNIENAMGFIKEYLPETILMLKEPNQKVRKLAHGMLTKILNTMKNFGIVESFIEMMSAGLASVSASGKVDTINALTLSLSSLDVHANSQFAKQLVDVVLVLLQESKPDILKAVINFLKKYIFLFPSSKNSLPEIMKGIFQTQQSSRLHILHLIKRLLLKLVKRDSKDSIMKIIPAEHQRLLKSLMKEEGKKKRAQRRKQQNRREQEKQEESSDDEDDIPKHGKNMNQMQVEENVVDRKKGKNNLLLKYDLDEERFHFVDGKKKQSKSKKKANQDAQEDDIAFIDGKLIIRESIVGKRKRPQDDGEEDDEKEEENNKFNSKKVVKANESALHQVKESGSSYKAARASGDLRIKNKPQPHAFIQLNPKALNKRYKQKADKVFEEFFEKKEGGLKGLKAKILKKRK